MGEMQGTPITQQSADPRAISLRPNVVATVIDNGAVLLDLTSKYFYSVNSTGWFIVESLESGATRRDILERCTSCGMSTDLAASVDAFIDTLKDYGLLDAASGPTETCDAPYSGEWETPTIERHREPLQRIMASAFDPSLPLAE